MDKRTKKSSLEDKQQSAIFAQEVYRLYTLEGLSLSLISKKTGYSCSTIYRKIRNFKNNNPEIVEQMSKKAKDLVPEDYKKLQDEICKLKKELKKESLRADFYDEMLSYGKEVYGIDLKKVGTK